MDMSPRIKKNRQMLKIVQNGGNESLNMPLSAVNESSSSLTILYCLCSLVDVLRVKESK